MATVYKHLSVEELEARYVRCQDAGLLHGCAELPLACLRG